MRRFILCLSLFITLCTQAQQINPVPDYVFSNRMSVGRNAVTDTAAYFSIGPRYGAIRGMMPPMVTDTASVSGTKRNGLLIFSVQKNKFLYWDSVGVKWAEMAGTAGTALTSADTAALLSTRAWRQKGIDSLAAIRIAGSGTTNYVPKFTASGTIGNSGIYDSSGFFGIGTTSPKERVHIFRASDSDVSIQVQNTSSRNYVITRRGGNLDLITSSGNILFTTNDVEKARITTAGNFGIMNQSPAYTLDVTGTLRSTGNTYLSTSSNETYVNTTTDAGDYKLQVSGNIYNTGSAVLNSVTIANNTPYITGSNISTASSLAIGSTSGFLSLNAANSIIQFNTNSAERGRINSAGEWIIDASGTDAGDYKLQVAGSIYNTTGAVLAAGSGSVLIGTTVNNAKLFVQEINDSDFELARFDRINTALTDASRLQIFASPTDNTATIRVGGTNNTSLVFQTSTTEVMRMTSGSELLIGTTTDAGAYALQVAGSIYNTTGYWTGSSGQLGIGVTSSSYPMEIIKDGNSIGIGNSIISIRGSGGDDQRLHFGYNGTNVSLIAAARTLAFTRYDLVADGWRESMRINNTGELLIGTTTDAGTYALQVTGAIYNTTTITTGAPSGGTAKPFKIGAAATVSPTSPNRTIEIEVDGTTYYIHAKTTND